MSQIEDQIKATRQQQKLVDQAATAAVGMALPGPAADAFALNPSIQVGKYSVRPIFDVDFEYFQMLKHPFASVAAGQSEELEKFVPRGPSGWVLFYVLTNPPEYIESILTGKDGVEDLHRCAKHEFGQYRLAALFSLYSAVIEQFKIFANMAVPYVANVTEEKDEAAKGAASAAPKDANSSATPLTV